MQALHLGDKAIAIVDKRGEHGCRLPEAYGAKTRRQGTDLGRATAINDPRTLLSASGVRLRIRSAIGEIL